MLISKLKIKITAHLDGELQHYVKMENNYIADFHKQLCDENGVLYNILDYKIIEEKEIFISFDCIMELPPIYRTVQYICLKLDKEINVGSCLNIVYNTTSKEQW